MLAALIHYYDVDVSTTHMDVGCDACAKGVIRGWYDVPAMGVVNHITCLNMWLNNYTAVNIHIPD